MKPHSKSIALTLMIAAAPAIALPTTYDPDLTSAFISLNAEFSPGSTLGFISSSSADSFTITGTTGPQRLYGPSYTVATVPNSFPIVGQDPGSLPSTQTHYLGNSASPNAPISEYINLTHEWAHDKVNYRSKLATRYGVDIDAIPTFERVLFDGNIIGALNFSSTSYSYTGGSLGHSFKSTFDVIWNENDVPNTHKAFANGMQITSGHYEVNGLVQYFQISNSDNSGGPSTLQISNLRWTGEPGIYPSISESTTTHSVVFLAAPIPEPSTYALTLVGLAAVGMMWRRQNRRT